MGRRWSGEGLAGASCGGGSGSLFGAGEAVAKAPGLGAFVDDVSAMGEAIDDRLGESGVEEHLGPLSERQVGGDDQRAALMAIGEHLEDQFGGAIRECEAAQLVQDDELGARVAADDASELAAALGLLELVGDRRAW